MTESNFQRTRDGVAAAGMRLAAEVAQIIRKHRTAESISFIAYRYVCMCMYVLEMNSYACCANLCRRYWVIDTCMFYIYIYIYIYMFVCVCVYVCIYTCLRICVCMTAIGEDFEISCIYVCMCVFMYVYTYNTCVYIYIYVCVCVCVCTYIHT